MTFPKSVHIRELGPREGFQIHPQFVPTPKKLELIELLGATGVTEIELTSLVRPDAIPQLADSDTVIQNYIKLPNIRYTALYLNKKGFERGEQSKRLDNQGWIYTATSDSFLKKNSNTSRAEVLNSIASWKSNFEAAGKSLYGIMISTAFGCAYEGQGVATLLLGHVKELLNSLGSLGASITELSLADTVGFANPEQIKRAVAEIRALNPGLNVSLHLHDTRGTAMANAYAGLQEGVSCFDASVGGLGGCPFTPGAAGNIATEDLVWMCEELGISTGINLGAYVFAAKCAERIIGKPLPGKYYKNY